MQEIPQLLLHNRAWAAEQLDVRVGDTVSMRFPTFGSARELVWRDTSFVVTGIFTIMLAARVLKSTA